MANIQNLTTAKQNNLIRLLKSPDAPRPEPIGFSDLVQTRSDLSATASNALGGYSVETTIEPIERMLVANTVCGKLGARLFTGLKGEFGVSFISTNFAVVEPATENTATSADASFAFTQVVAKPQRISVEGWVSSQLVHQAKERDLLGFLAAEFGRLVGSVFDGLALTANGVGYGTITGLVNNANVQTVTFGATVTNAKIQGMIESVSALNAGFDSRGFAISPVTRQKLATVQEATGTSFFIYDSHSKTISGEPVAETTDLSSNNVVYGNWGDLALCVWNDHADVLVDHFFQAGAGVTRIVYNLLGNIAVRRPTFCVSPIAERNDTVLGD
jgi:HK97 family phage major capsid protein